MPLRDDIRLWARYYARRAAEGFGGEPRPRGEVEPPIVVDVRRQQVLRYIARHSPAAAMVLSAGVGT